MSLGSNIRNKRISLKFSQAYVAEQLEVSRQAVSKWETNQSEPSTSNLMKLADLFDCDVKETISPEKYLDEPKNAKKSVTDQTQRNIKMQLAAFFGRILLLVAFLGGMGAYNEQIEQHLKIWWGVIFFIGAGLTFMASRDYFNEKNGSKKVIFLDLMFIFSFFLYYIIPFERSVSTLITLMYGAVVLSIINIKFFIPVWRKP